MAVSKYPGALVALKFIAGSHAELIACFAEALARQPDHPLTHNNLAVVYNEMRDEEAAFEHWRQAATLDSTRADIYFNIAQAYQSGLK